MSDSNESPLAPESDNPPPPSDFSPPPQSENSSPPATADAQSPPPSPASPPPPDSSSSSPPPSTKSPPPSPPPPSSSPSPPSDSNSPPPEATTTHEPSPPPPEPEPSPPPSSKPEHSPPPPPSSSHSKKSPPKSETPPSPPIHDAPSPSSDESSPPGSGKSQPKSPPPPESESGPSPVSPPATPDTEPVQNTTPPTPPNEFAPPTTSSSNPSITPPPPISPLSSNGGASLSPPRSSSKAESSSSSSNTSSSESNGNARALVAVAVAGVFIIALIALFFIAAARRRRKRQEAYNAAHYMPAGTFSVKSEGYYVGPNSGPAESFYVKQTPNSFILNSYGSQRGNAAPSHGGGLESGLIGGSNPYFSYEELTEITNGFSRQNVIGEGGFGCVYKGWLPDGRVVAVKQLKAGSGQGEREFRAEVEIISRVHHRHLVSLVGYCIAEHQRLLIYEFVPNQTLEHHLHGDGMLVLDWTKRLKIALGAAKGLAYLHEDCHPKIIHRDIKSANILLDDAFEAQVADFGLAKPSNDTHTHVSTRVMGTFGYMAPEYASSGKLTDRSDVFSFGVVLLELVTGRKSVDPTQPLGDESLVEWARPLLIQALESGDLSELVDPRLEKHYVESEMIRMIEAAAACVRHSAPKRPRMVQVVRALDCESEMSDLTNGMKYGQSTIYESGQYNQDIMRFRKMALGSGDSSEYDMYSGEFNNTREVSGHQTSWNNFQDVSSGESETRAFTARNVGEPRYSGPQSNFGGRRL